MNKYTSKSKSDFTLDDVLSIIDKHMDEERIFDFTVNKDLAKEIYDYITEEYYVSDESENPFDEDIDVYYISVLFDIKGFAEKNLDADIALYCGNAKGSNNKWLYNESDNIDYYFGIDINESDIEDYFVGFKRSTWTEFNYLGDIELLDDDEDCCDADCDTCPDNDECESKPTDSDIAERDMIINLADEISDMSCPSCIAQKLFELAYTFKEFGYDEARLEMQEFLSDD